MPLSEAGSDDFDDYTPAPSLPQGIRKEIITEAEKDVFAKPKSGDDVTIEYTGTLEADGSEFDSSQKHSTPFVVTLGKGQLVQGLDLGIATMKKGEVVKFTLQPELGYGEAGKLPEVPPDATLVYTVTLVSFVSKLDLFGDEGVIKSLLEEGSGFERPKKQAEVRISLKKLAADGSVIEERKAIDYVLGSEQFGPFNTVVHKAVTSMKKGERCSLKCSGSYANGGVDTLELVLEEIYEIVDVSFRKDGTVMKKVLQKSDAYGRPDDGEEVVLKVESVTDKAGVTLPNFTGPQELSFRCGLGGTCDALEFAAANMSTGERSAIICTERSKACDKSLGLAEVKEDTVIFVVELISYEKLGIRPDSLGPEHKVELANLRKDEGALLFERGRFELALQKYNKVKSGLQDTNKLPDDYKVQFRDLKKAAESNISACYLKLGDLANTLATCNGILKEEPSNVKALFRRAKAHYGRAEHHDAARDLERLLELDPANSAAKALLPHVKRAQKLADKESRSTFSKMCDGLGKIGSGRDSKPQVPEPKKEEEEEPQAPPDTCTVTFQIEYKPAEGEHLRVYGAPEVLGAWDAEKSIEMRKLPQKWEPPTGSGKIPPEVHMWEAVAEVPQGEGRAEYKYIIRGNDGDRIERSGHRVNVSGMGGSRQRCRDSWAD
eukprot:TRINITY_DN47709_c0_g1_i1.p1 TRINITY_DN47709_c0_g1~~TRINITY_DN47709_c0_g1_i1.p1  ORF type:complete len:663 (+),score=182.51 TRINITY_DN47709_c0_g1_i1:44-2032(+)